MKKLFTLLMPLLLILVKGQSEPPGVLWNTSISSGATQNFSVSNIYQYADGNFLMTGMKDEVVQLTKATSTGGMMWQNTYTQLGSYELADGALDVSGNIHLATESGPGQSSRLAKIDPTGNLIWHMDLAVPGLSPEIVYAEFIKPFSDGSIIVGGNFEDDTESGYFFSKYDSGGNLIWNKKKTHAAAAYPVSGVSKVQVFDDGSFVCLGVTYTGTKVFTWVGKFNSTGDPVWSNNVDLNGSVGETDPGDFLVSAAGDVVVATDYITTTDEVIISLSKYSASGAFTWQKNFPVAEGDFNSLKIIEFSPNETTLGYSLPFMGSGVGVFKKILSNGDLAWQHQYSGAPFEGVFTDFIKTTDGNIMLLSEHQNNNSYLLYKMGGSLSVVNIDKESLKIYPNPVKDLLHFSEDVSVIKISDASGRMVRNLTVNGKSVNMAKLPKGVYLMSITTNKGETFTRKIIKE